MKKNLKQKSIYLVLGVIILIILGIMLFFIKKDETKPSSELLKEARQAKDSSNYDEAISKYEKVLQDNPQVSVQAELGNTYLKNKNYDKAVEIFQKIVDNNPNDSFNINNLANIYRSSGDINQAIEYYKKGIELGNSDSVTNLVTIYNTSEQYDQSISLLNSMIEKNPADDSLARLLASTYSKKGNIVKAQEVLNSIE